MGSVARARAKKPLSCQPGLSRLYEQRCTGNVYAMAKKPAAAASAISVSEIGKHGENKAWRSGNM